MRLRVVVQPKPGVLDPQGRAIAAALGDLGYTEIAEVRTGKVIDLELATDDAELARARVREMCEKLLANPVIERFEILPLGSGRP
jgi:phosphoribosylformylglycinamidine synthase